MTKSFLTRIRKVCKFFDVSEFHHSVIAKGPISQRATYFKTESLYTANLGQLTCFKFLRDVVNIAKNTNIIHGMFVAVVVTKRKGFSSVLTFSKNQHHLSPQQAGFIVDRNRISVIVVPK